MQFCRHANNVGANSPIVQFCHHRCRKKGFSVLPVTFFCFAERKKKLIFGVVRSDPTLCRHCNAVAPNGLFSIIWYFQTRRVRENLFQPRPFPPTDRSSIGGKEGQVSLLTLCTKLPLFMSTIKKIQANERPLYLLEISLRALAFTRREHMCAHASSYFGGHP